MLPPLMLQFWLFGILCLRLDINRLDEFFNRKDARNGYVDRVEHSKWQMCKIRPSEVS